jgi:transcriptional regulator with XRE-family HTH domain
VSSFAEKLDKLFTTIRRPDGSQFTMADVASEISAAGDVKLSASYLSELRSGRKDNPNIWVVNAIAEYFGQPIEYFVVDGMEPVQPSPTIPERVSPDLGTIAGRVRALLRALKPNGVGDPSDDQLIRWMRQQGYDIDPAALAALRTGSGDVGSDGIVSALAKYLGVPEAILVDEAAANAIIPTLPLLKAMQDKKLRRLALRAGTLDPNDLQRVADLVNRLANDDQADVDLDF